MLPVKKTKLQHVNFYFTFIESTPEKFSTYLCIKSFTNHATLTSEPFSKDIPPSPKNLEKCSLGIYILLCCQFGNFHSVIDVFTKGNSIKKTQIVYTLFPRKKSQVCMT
jgi:hypothetical protein